MKNGSSIVYVYRTTASQVSQGVSRKWVLSWRCIVRYCTTSEWSVTHPKSQSSVANGSFTLHLPFLWSVRLTLSRVMRPTNLIYFDTFFFSMYNKFFLFLPTDISFNPQWMSLKLISIHSSGECLKKKKSGFIPSELFFVF